MTRQISNPHDKLFKQVLGEPENAAAFVANNLPARRDCRSPRVHRKGVRGAWTREQASWTDSFIRSSMSPRITEKTIIFLSVSEDEKVRR